MSAATYHESPDLPGELNDCPRLTATEREALLPQVQLTDAQETALTNLCEAYGVEFDPVLFHDGSGLGGLADGWVMGKVGPITIGCSPEGNIHS